MKARISMLETLKTIPHTGTEFTTYLSNLDADFKAADTALTSATTSVEDLRFKCREAQADQRRSGGTSTDPIKECAELESSESQLVKALAAKTSAEAAKGGAENEYGANSVLQSQVSSVITNLQSQISIYENQLPTAPGAVPGYVVEANGTRELTNEERDDEWTTFDFDSSEAQTETNSQTKSYSASLSFGAKGGLWSVKGDAQYSRTQSKFSEDISQANVKITAKFLKVKINRPWVRTTLFKNPGLISVSLKNNNYY